MMRFNFLIIFIIAISNVRSSAQDSILVADKRTDSLSIVEKKVDTLYGIASYYSDKFVGRKTANGEIFSQDKMTAACNLLPLGAWISVTNLRNNRVVEVKINDRLHPKNKRIVDLTYLAAKKLGFLRAGLTSVRVDVLGKSIKKK